jgi:hypothetical protein
MKMLKIDSIVKREGGEERESKREGGREREEG